MTKDNDSLGDLSTDGDKRPARIGDSLSNDLTHADWSAGDLFQDWKYDVVELTKKYSLHRVLGKGGMSIVFLGSDKLLSRKVAIKILNKEQAGNHNGVTRFLNEGKAVAKLNHPQIVQIHDAGLSTDGPFLVMEYVPGGSLQDKLNEGSIPANEAVGIITRLCDGLQIAHDEGITHRDIKPANILLDLNGTPKLADFGIARQDSIDDGLTRLGTTLGTIDYMPPEQRRDATDVDARSDIWSLAGTLYRMLTGEPPLALDHDLVPSEYREAVKRGLKYNRSERFQSVTEFKLALDGNGSQAVTKAADTIVPSNDLNKGQLKRSSAKEYLKRGISYMARDDHQKAIADYMETNELEPDDAVIRLLSTYPFFPGNGLDENIRKSIDECTKAIELEPGFVKAYYTRAIFYDGLGEYQKAIDDYSKAIALNPAGLQGYHLRGSAYHTLGEYQKAIDDYSKVIELDPEVVESYLGCGRAYKELGEYQKAINDYGKSIELSPELASAYFERGTAYGRLNQGKKSADDIIKAIILAPEYAMEYLERGRAYNAGSYSKWMKGINDYIAAIEFDRDSKLSHQLRGDVYLFIGEYRSANEKYSKAIDLNSKSSYIYCNRGTAYTNRGEHRSAIDDFTNAIKVDPSYAEAYYRRGCSYEKLGETQKAVADYSKAIELYPEFKSYDKTNKTVRSFLNRGKIYRSLGEYQKAIDDYSKGLAIRSDASWLYKHRGEVYFELREFQKAINDYSKAISMGGVPGYIYYHRGVSYEALGQYRKAIGDYSELIDLATKDAEAYQRRGVCNKKLGRNDEAESDFASARRLANN